MKNFFFRWTDAYNERWRRRGLGEYCIIKSFAFGLMWRLYTPEPLKQEDPYATDPKDELTLKKLKKAVKRKKKFFTT